MIIVDHEQPSPEILMELLERHHLLPMSIRMNPMAIQAVASSCNIFTVKTDTEVSMAVVEYPGGEPGTARAEFIALQKRIDKVADIYAEHRELFYDRWFNGYRLHRIDTCIPSTRKQVPRVLKALGFVEETFRGVGIRNAVDFGRGPESLYLFSLTPADVNKPVATTEKPDEAIEVSQA
jgi:hypothetical protein